MKKILDESERAVEANDRIREITGEDVTSSVTYGDDVGAQSFMGYREGVAEGKWDTLSNLNGGVVSVHLHVGDSTIAFATAFVVIVSVTSIVATVNQ